MAHVVDSSSQSLTPLIFSFELPIMSASQIMPDSTSPYVVKIQEQYNVQVMFRTRPKLHATLVVVKGCEWEVSHTKEATMLLIHYMCQNLAVSTIVVSHLFLSLFKKSFLLVHSNSFFFVLLRLESDTSTNVNGDLAATPQRRAGEAEQQFEDDHAAHWHSDHVPGRRRSEHSQLEEEQRHDHRWHPQRLLGSATIGGRL